VTRMDEPLEDIAYGFYFVINELETCITFLANREKAILLNTRSNPNTLG
jgi:hypothetical protein